MQCNCILDSTFYIGSGKVALSLSVLANSTTMLEHLSNLVVKVNEGSVSLDGALKSDILSHVQDMK